MKQIIKIQDVSYRIPFGQWVLNDINVEIFEGQFIGVLGHNGAGKTTLVDLLMGFRKPTKGHIHLFNEDPHSLNFGKAKEQVCFLSQDVGLKGDISIAKFLQFHSSFFPNYSKDD
jgi:ABC-type multidrug transport system ATPase subunit